MYTINQSLQLVQQHENEPTLTWQLAKCAAVGEKSLLHWLGLKGIEIVYNDEGKPGISKADVRKLMGMEGEL